QHEPAFYAQGASTMRTIAWCVAALVFVAGAEAADFGTRGGPAPANIDEITDVLRQDPYDMELLISFGTSKGGSAGHLALAIRDPASGDDLVYSDAGSRMARARCPAEPPLE